MTYRNRDLLLASIVLFLMLSTFALVAVGSPTSSSQVVAKAQEVRLDDEVEQVEVIGHLGGEAEAVFVEGNYAYVGFGPKVVILDISDPTQPKELGNVVLPGLVRDIHVGGNYAYVAANGARSTWTSGRFNEASLHVIDISERSAPAKVSTYVTPRDIKKLDVVGDYVYIAWGGCLWHHVSSCASGLEIVSLSDPTTPIEIARYNSQSSSPSVAVAGHYAYLNDGGTMKVIDISVPASPVQISSVSTTSRYDIAVVGEYAYLAGSELSVVNISNPTAPVIVGTYPGRFYNLSVQANMLVATGSISTDQSIPQRLHFFDRSNPAALVEVASYDTNDQANQVSVIGDIAYVAAGSEGLHMLDLSTPSSPTEMVFYNPLRVEEAYDVKVVGEIAYVIASYYSSSTNDRRLFVVDISNPIMPLVLTFFDLPAETENIEIAGHYAYIAVDTGLLVLDIENPVAPSEVGIHELTGGVAGITIVDNVAYVVNSAGLQIIDIENPAAPRSVGSFLERAYAEVAVEGKYAYVVSGGSVIIVDIEDPTNPTEVGSYNRFEVYYTGRYRDVAVKDNSLYASWTHCYLPPSPRCFGGVDVIDLTDPTALSEIGFYSARAWAWDLELLGNQLYVAHGWAGLRLVDISTPTAPVELPSYNSGGYARRVTIANDLILVADREGGLLILRQPLVSISGQVRQPNGLAFGDVTITTNTALTTTTDASGVYTFTNLSPEPRILTPTVAGYHFWPPTRTVTLPPDATEQDFTILPAPVSMTLVPSTTSSLTFTDTQGLPTQLTFPADAITQTTTVTVTPTLQADEPDFASTTHAFELVASQGDQHLTDFTFRAPLTLTVQYSDLDIRLVANENELVLWLWRENSWQDASQTCEPASAYKRDLANNTISLPICQTGGLGLFGPTNQLYVPLLIR